MWIILAKSHFFGQNGLRKLAHWSSPDSDKISKIVEKDRQNVYEVYQSNYEGLIDLGILGGSFFQKVHYLVKMDSKNQLRHVPLIQIEKHNCEKGSKECL